LITSLWKPVGFTNLITRQAVLVNHATETIATLDTSLARIVPTLGRAA
jgi:hypothetical protein